MTSEQESNLTVENPAKRKAEFELRQEQAQREYDALVAQGLTPEAMEDPEVAALRAKGYDIPDATPQEPEYLVRHEKVDEITPGAFPRGRNGRVRSIREPNPRYVTPEMRAAAIRAAREAEMHRPPTAPPTFTGVPTPTFTGPAPPTFTGPRAPVTPMQYANHVQNLLEGEFVVTGWQMANNQLVVSLIPQE